MRVFCTSYSEALFSSHDFFLHSQTQTSGDQRDSGQNPGVIAGFPSVLPEQLLRAFMLLRIPRLPIEKRSDYSYKLLFRSDVKARL